MANVLALRRAQRLWRCCATLLHVSTSSSSSSFNYHHHHHHHRAQSINDVDNGKAHRTRSLTFGNEQIYVLQHRLVLFVLKGHILHIHRQLAAEGLVVQLLATFAVGGGGDVGVVVCVVVVGGGNDLACCHNGTSPEACDLHTIVVDGDRVVFHPNRFRLLWLVLFMLLL